MTIKAKKIIKRTVISLLVSGSVITMSIFLIDGYSPSMNLFSENNAAVATSFIVGFCFGITFLLWYPLTRLMAWAKTRNLKNRETELNILLKEKELQKSKMEIAKIKATDQEQEKKAE